MRSLLLNRSVFLLGCLFLVAGTAPGQDLGSSNKLFGGTKAKTTSGSSKKVVKKTPAKPKAVVAKTKPAPSKTKPVASKPKPTTQRTITTAKGVKITIPVSKPKTDTSATTQASRIDIVPTQPSEPVITGAAADDLFEELIETGNTARDDRNYSAAETAYRRARTIKPKDSRAVYGLGNLYVDLQRWEDAEKSYRTALQLDSGNAIANIALSYVLIQPLATSNLGDRYEEAETLARRAIQLAPSNALAFDQLGVAMELRGLIGPETENAYRRSIQLDRTFAPAYAHLGRLLRRRGLTKESAAAYQDAIQRSTDAATMILVADVMQSEQRFADSEPLLRKALASDPRNPSALLMLGHSLTTQGKFAEAESVIKMSLAVSTNGFMANSMLGSLYMRQGKFEQAENALLQALRYVSALEKRRLSQQFEAVGDGYMKAGKAANAQRSYKQAVDLDPENEFLAGKFAKVQRG